MRRLLQIALFLFLITGAEAFAQQVSQDSIKELSLGELKKAQDLYIQMMATDTYKQYWASVREVNLNTKGLEFPKLKDLDSIDYMDQIRDIFRNWLTENLAKTKYRSVDEGLKSIMKWYELGKKRMDENKELYTLMARASREQIHEILVHEHQAKKLLIQQ